MTTRGELWEGVERPISPYKVTQNPKDKDVNFHSYRNPDANPHYFGTFTSCGQCKAQIFIYTLHTLHHKRNN
jgi:hypothetical protein